MFNTRRLYLPIPLVSAIFLLSACANKVTTSISDAPYQAALERGLRYANQNQWELARDSFAIYSRAAHEENNMQAAANGLVNRAVSLRSLGQNHFSHYLMHQLFQLAPERQALNENYATGLIDIGEFEKAENELNEIITAGNADSNTYHARGLVRLHTKKYGAALKDFSEEKELNPHANEMCYEKAKELVASGKALKLTSDDRKEIENVFEAHKEAMRLSDGAATLETLSKIWLDSYFSNIKRKALFASTDEMNGLEVFDTMMVYYLRNHYLNNVQGLKDQLPLDLFIRVIDEGWIKGELKRVDDGVIIFDAKIIGYQPILSYRSCDDFYSVYTTFDGSLAGWKQNFTREKNSWRVSSSHLIDIFRMASAEYSQELYEGGSALWVTYGVVKQKLSEQAIQLSPDVVKPLELGQNKY